MSTATGIASWAKVFDPAIDQYNPEGIWSIDLKVTDEEKERLEKLGLKGKQSDPSTFVFKRHIKKKDGSPIQRPTVVDANKSVWDSNKLIGNGSTVNVAFSTYEHQASSVHGLGKTLKAVQVVKHVPYEGGGDGTNEFEALDTEDDF